MTDGHRTRRVWVGGERCTVRWEGEVGDTGHWLGVEWDREGRGKHDGEHQGTRYFTPVRQGGNCSFIRESKVTGPGVGLLEAVVSKYGEVEGSLAGVEQRGIDELQAEIGARFVEVVGLDKVNKQQSQVKQLRTVSVRRMGVRGVETCDLEAELPSLRDLDLSDTLVTHWTELATIITNLKLDTVDLSGNLIDISSLSDSTPTMPTLKHLILGNMLYTGYTWSNILSVV